MTLEQLAVEIAERNDRCGHVHAENICLRQSKHEGAHQFEPLRQVIPIN